MSFHRDQILDDIHVVNARVYADVAARDADVPFQVATNVNKVVRIDAPVSFFLLTSVAPTVWQELTTTLSDSFLELVDTPSSYAGKALQVVRVDLGEVALEFSTAGMGDVSGPPAGATDQAIARFDETTGRILQDSVVIVDDAGVISGITQWNLNDGAVTFIEGLNNAQFAVRTHDLTPSTFLERAEFSIIPEAPQFAHDHGDGAGNVTESQHILLNDLVMQVLDTINNRGLVYAANYSANFQTRSLVDKGFVDSADNARVVGPASAVDNALARFDTTTGKLIQDSVVIIDDAGVVDGISQINVTDATFLRIIGENAADLLIELNDLTLANWLQRGRVVVEPGFTELVHETGNGTGGAASSQGLVFSTALMEIIDGLNAKGLEYNADYSAQFTARSLVDKAFVDAGDADHVVGPALATDNAITLFDGTTGKVIKNSVVIVDVSGVVSGVKRLLVDDKVVIGGADTFGTGISLALAEADHAAVLNVLTDSQELTITDAAVIAFNSNKSALRARIGGFPDDWVYASNIDEVLFVRVKADLPAPAAGVIAIPAGTVIFLEANVNLGSDRLELGFSGPEGGTIIGYGVTQSIFTSNSSVSTVDMIEGTDFFLQNCRIINTGSGDAIRVGSGASVFYSTIDLVGPIDLILFTLFEGDESLFNGPLTIPNDNPSALLNLRNTTFVVANGAKGIDVPAGVTVGQVRLNTVLFDLGNAASRGIVVNDPDAILNGRLVDITVKGIGTEILGVDPGLGTAISLGFDPRGMTVHKGDLYVVNDAANTIVKYLGISNNVDFSIASPGTSPRDIVFVGDNLVSCNASPFRVDIHAGFTIVVTSSFTPSQAPVALTFNGVNLIVMTQLSGAIEVMDGISGTILETLSGVSFGDGLHFDGANLWVGQFDEIQIRQGVSDIIQYRIDIPEITGNPSNAIRGFAQTTPGGPLIFTEAVADSAFVTDHPVTFDQSSPTWQMHEIAGILDSSDYGCVCVRVLTGASIVITLQNLWTDLNDFGTSIIYTLQAGAEKFILTDPENGEMTYIGVLPKAFEMSGLLLAEGIGGVELSIEIGISVNGRDPTLDAACTMANGIVNNATQSTLTSPSASVRLVENDTIKLQVRNRTNDTNITIFQVLMAANG